MITAQGIYYLITGAWPILHMESFLEVTGPKTDLWLVRMVGLLTMVISIELLASVRNDRTSYWLPFGAALSYLIIDSYYSLNGTISPIYLADAAVETIFLMLLIISWRRSVSGKETH